MKIKKIREMVKMNEQLYTEDVVLLYYYTIKKVMTKREDIKDLITMLRGLI